MEIVSIFAAVEGSLLTVLYDEYDNGDKGYPLHELTRLIDNWTDPIYLKEFFTKHENDLKNGFWGEITIQEAIERTIAEADALEARLYEIAEKGKTDKIEHLSGLFKPLHNKKATRAVELEASKVYGPGKQSWLRIYAIRIETNVFVISGGAIKLTANMQGRTHTLLELDKLEITKQFLIDNSLVDKEDFDFTEYKPE